MGEELILHPGDAGSTATVTLAIGTNPGGALSGTTSVAAVAGVATFSNVIITGTGGNYGAGGGGGGASNNVSPGPGANSGAGGPGGAGIVVVITT